MVKGLKLFIADVIDEDTNEQTIWYVVGKTYDSALSRFIKKANRIWHRYAYYFYEADDDAIEDFTDNCTNIIAGIYEK